MRGPSGRGHAGASIRCSGWCRRSDGAGSPDPGIVSRSGARSRARRRRGPPEGFEEALVRYPSSYGGSARARSNAPAESVSAQATASAWTTTGSGPRPPARRCSREGRPWRPGPLDEDDLRGPPGQALEARGLPSRRRGRGRGRPGARSWSADIQASRTRSVVGRTSRPGEPGSAAPPFAGDDPHPATGVRGRVGGPGAGPGDSSAPGTRGS
jgi:hypothetical protein